MNKAMAFFLRTRRLDIRRMERKPQENLGVVHTILTAAVKDVLDKLKKLERGFYGLGRNATDEIRRWVPCCRAVMHAAQLPHLNSLVTINDIITKSQDPRIQFTLDAFELNKFKECLRKINEAVPVKFSELVLDSKRILKYLEKYCRSFYQIENGIFLDTAHHYEKQIRYHSGDIRHTLDKIDAMYEKFRTSVLTPAEMSPYARELAQKHDCLHFPFLLLFPESCECIRTVCSTMSSWITADENYATFISNDINDLAQKKEEVSRVLRDSQAKFHQLHQKWKEVNLSSIILVEIIPSITGCNRRANQLGNSGGWANQLGNSGR